MSEEEKDGGREGGREEERRWREGGREGREDIIAIIHGC